MRDYYKVLLEKNHRNTEEHEPTKPTKDPSVGFVGSVVSEYLEKFAEECSESVRDANMQRNEIFEERIAIMMYDGRVSQREAIRNAIVEWGNSANECE